MTTPRDGKRAAGKKLRSGFSTGTAATAAARAALRALSGGGCPRVVAVRLPAGYYYPVTVAGCGVEAGWAWAAVVKDAGDDPDVTHGAEVRVRVRPLPGPPGLALVAGRGVGRVTRPGLPVAVGEPAVNPVPRAMLVENLAEELRSGGALPPPGGAAPVRAGDPVFLPWGAGAALEVVIEVPEGERLAVHTLNPRLGIVGGISILGTTGLVRPLSHEAYEETIRSAMKVARAGGAQEVVLTTGGKSEKLARSLLPELPEAAFVQIADFFAFSVSEARIMGFTGVIHAIFFGKAVKMAAGHEYTHAHRAALDTAVIAEAARGCGLGEALASEVASANTARHALEILDRAGSAGAVLESVALRAANVSRELSGGALSVRLLLFDYDGVLRADVAPWENRHDGAHTGL